MVSSKLFYQVHKCMNEIFCSGQDFPFGGKSVSVCRDLYQILPVRAESVFTFNETETMEGLISSDLWQKFRLAEFDQVMRQDDEILINLLYKIRVGQIDQNTEHVIKSRFIDKDDTSYSGNILDTFAENAPVKRHNDNRLKHIPGKLITITAKDEVPKNSKNSDVREAQNRKMSETGSLVSVLKLKINARFILTTNINTEDRLINGPMGTVKHTESRNKEVQTIYLELDDKCAGKLRMSGSDITAKNNKWVPIKREETSIFLIKYQTTSPAITRTQFPVVLSWACTVHKVQGLSLTSVVVSFDLEKQRSFNKGQMYVALSRATSIDNIFLIGKYTPNVFKVNENAILEYKRLQENRFDTIDTDHADCNRLTISLLNPRLLTRHAADVSKARQLTENDILCLTESQITNDTDITEVLQQLSSFKIYFNSCAERYQELAICLRENILLKHDISRHINY